ncbi:MAG: prepilin-type N-terminal cleavage/methylation domain-containing protein [Planctomycetota bacterium]
MISQKQGPEAGFTLVELLVVIAIIAVMGGFGITMLMSAREQGDDFAVQGFIQSVDATLEQYKNDRRIGVYPPSSLDGFAGLGSQKNRTNQGIEALVVALNSPNFKATRVLEAFEGEESVLQMDNLDGDRSAKNLTIHGTRELFEILDPWGNPFVYFNANDYAKAGIGKYMVMSEENGEYEVTAVRPWKNPKTQSFFRLDSFQLFSAGPDMKFNTDDDIGNW